MKLRDILHQKNNELVTIRQDQTLHQASRLLHERHIGVLLVFDADDKPVGILSERDIVRVLAERGADSPAVTVGEAMTPDLIVGVPDDELTYAMNVMTQQRIRHLPVLEGESLVGLVSIGDIVKAQISQAETEIHYLQSYITGGY